MVIRIGTRSSPLALKQTELFVAALVEKNLASVEECLVIPIQTTGDVIQDRPLADIGGKALFAKEIETALVNKEIDCAVHSLKDMESILPPGLEIAAVLPRESPWDVWISREHFSFEDIPQGSIVGSCAPRRRAQLLALRPDLEIKSIRGNVQTRFKKLENGQYDALILADAGLIRLGIRERITERLPLNLMVPAIGQGVIAIECRRGDVKIKSFLTKINHMQTYYRSVAERALLRALQGGCRTPIAGFASLTDQGQIRLIGVLADETGNRMVRCEAIGPDPIALGVKVAKELQTKLIKLSKDLG